MKALIPIFALFLGSASMARPAAPGALTTLHAIHALTGAQAGQVMPVVFEATVTYFRDFEKTMFVQDEGEAIYVNATTDLKLVPGDRIRVLGTVQEDFRPYVVSNDITLLDHGSLPKPVPATFESMIQARLDCLYVVVHGAVRSANLQLSGGRHVTQLEVSMDGGYVGVTMDNGDPARLNGWLDSEVEITGAAAGQFDGKMQQAGVLLHSSSFKDVKILRRAAQDPWQTPLTPMDQVLNTLNVDDHTGRVRVEGTITYYHQASMAVLQDGNRSIRVLTPEVDPLRVGDRAEAIGIPFVDNGFLTLKMGAIRSTGDAAPIVPVPVSWDQLASGKHAFDLVSIEGIVVTQVREQSQDVYIVSSQGRLFSAAVRHPFVYEWGVVKIPPPMPVIPQGSKVRITGVAILDDGNPFNGAIGFGILLRSADDVVAINGPPLLTVRNLVLIVGLLLLVVVAVGVRSLTLERRVRMQTATVACVERRRGGILEDINGTRPLAEILEQITELVSFKLHGAPSWCEIKDGARLGNHPPNLNSLRVIQIEIPAHSGAALGTFSAAFDSMTRPTAEESEAVSMGAGLGALAIETRRLYSDLMHRSEFDLLTDIQNRFSLERYLDALIEATNQTANIFGLIYIDLDNFKEVNDDFGHQAGDLCLQEAALRMKQQLRPGDILARLGGDEFAVLVPVVRSRSDVEEIALRLEHCFDEVFALENYLLHSSASVGIALYPADATTKDSLLSAADVAMYVAKNAKKSKPEMQVLVTGLASHMETA